MLRRRGPLHYCSGSSHDSDAIALPPETVDNIETVLKGLRPTQLAACKCASILKDISRSQITKPRRAKANDAVVFATPVERIRWWSLPEHIQRLLQPSSFQPRLFGDRAVRKKRERRQVDVLPSLVQGIHGSHQPLLAGWIVGCLRCKRIVGRGAIVRTALARECAGILKESTWWTFIMKESRREVAASAAAAGA